MQILEPPANIITTTDLRLDWLDRHHRHLPKARLGQASDKAAQIITNYR